MKKYEVRIRAELTKTMVVEAEDAEKAVEAAHQDFDLNCASDPEKYEQVAEEVRELTEETQQ